MKKNRLHAIIFLFALFALGVPPAVHAAVDLTGYEQVWRDDFSSATLNPNHWTYDAGVGVWNTEANQEIQFYTDRPQNVRIENDVLVIEAHQETADPDGNYAFTSGRVKTSGRMSFQYGILRARIRLTDLANGLWPAFWTLGDTADGWPQTGEIDILEAGHSSLIAAGTVNQQAMGVIHWCWQPEPVPNPWEFHTFFPNPANNEPAQLATVDSLQDWNLWTLVWTDTSIMMYVNDQPTPYFEFGYDPEAIFEFTRPQFILLNLAVGGLFPGIFTPAGITAPFPARMEVDYIELWQQPGVGSFYTADSPGARRQGNVAVGEFAEGTDGLEIDSRILIDDDFGYLFSWNNLDFSDGPDPSEGELSLGISVPNPGEWYGGGFQTLSNYINFQRFAGGYVVFDFKTTTQTPFRFGIGSMATGNGEVAFGPGEEKWGLVRDGQWHTVRIPIGAFGGNVDLATVNILLYLVNDPPGQAVTMELDNLYWEEAQDQPTPENGNYGVFTETPANQTAGSLAFETEGSLLLWEGSLIDGPATPPSEGSEVWSFRSAPGFGWWGGGIYCYHPLNLTAFENGTLHFDMRTTDPRPFFVGMKTSLHRHIGQLWIPFPGGGNDPYGFARDGQWHTISIPVQELKEQANLNLFEVVQLFQVLGTAGPLDNLGIDNIYFSGGETAIVDRWGDETATPAPIAIVIRRADETDVEISFPSEVGFNYRMEYSDDYMLSWKPHGDRQPGDGEEMTLVHPGGLNLSVDTVVYRIVIEP